MHERSVSSWHRRRRNRQSSFHTDDDTQRQRQQRINSDGNEDESVRLDDTTLSRHKTTSFVSASTWKGHDRASTVTAPFHTPGCRGGFKLVVFRFAALAALWVTLYAGSILRTNSNSRMLRRQSSSLQHPKPSLHMELSGVPLSQVPYSTFPYYSPSVLTRQQVSLEDFFIHDDATNQHDSYETPVLHFVHSRFMQEQGNLTSLAMARLYLLEVFCLPTMVAQTTSNFLWLIRIDPDLDAAVMALLRESIQPYPHMYLIASNHNFRINEDFPGAWRDGAQISDLRTSRIYTGDPIRLAQAFALVDDVLILDTRLDADDGLHIDYLRSLQNAARKEFYPDNRVDLRTPTLKWKYWCARRHLAWHWALPQIDQNDDHDDPTHDAVLSPSSVKPPPVAGYLTGTQTSHMCITPGFTVAFPVGVRESDVPVYGHHELIQKLQHLPAEQSCIDTTTTAAAASAAKNDHRADPGDAEERCFSFVSTHAFEAIRSRTPTSAGMLAVADDPGRRWDGTSWLEYAFWDVVWDDFGLRRAQIAWMQSYLTTHLRRIGQDNLLGQCTTGHSCKVIYFIIIFFARRCTHASEFS